MPNRSPSDHLPPTLSERASARGLRRPAISFHASEGEAQFHRHVMHEHVLNEDIFVFSGESMSQIFEANNSNHLISRIIESSVFIMAYILQILLHSESRAMFATKTVAGSILIVYSYKSDLHCMCVHIISHTAHPSLKNDAHMLRQKLQYKNRRTGTSLIRESEAAQADSLYHISGTQYTGLYVLYIFHIYTP
jgi:hypothetical protein